MAHPILQPEGYTPPALPDDLQPWDAQKGETAKWFHAFCHYRDLPTTVRSTDRAWRDHQTQCLGKQPPRLKRADHSWHTQCRDWGWVERAFAFDREKDRQAREKLVKDQLEARARHARIANATMAALSVPSRVVLEALQDPQVMKRLLEQAQKSTKAFVKLVDLVSWASRSIPGLVTVERLALGLSTEQIAVEEAQADPTGRTIANDPATAALALELLGRLSERQPPMIGMGDGDDDDVIEATPSEPAEDEAGTEPE